MSKHQKKGYTLVEILVVLTIIAVMMAAAIVSYGSITRKSRDSKRRSDMEQVRQALEMYRADNGGYPECWAGEGGSSTKLSECLGPVLTAGGYLSSIPQDPKSSTAAFAGRYWYWANNYSPGIPTQYCLFYIGETDENVYSPGTQCGGWNFSELPPGYVVYMYRNP